MEGFRAHNRSGDGSYEGATIRMGDVLVWNYARTVDTRVRHALESFGRHLTFDAAIDHLNRLKDDADRIALAQVLPAEKIPAREERRRIARTTRQERELLGWTKMPGEVGKILERKRREVRMAPTAKA